MSRPGTAVDLYQRRRSSLKFQTTKGEVEVFATLFEENYVSAKSKDKKLELVRGCLIDAAKNGHIANVRYLLDKTKEADVNTTEIEGNENNLVMLARISDMTEMVNFLVSRGANITQKNKEGQTVLDIRPIALSHLMLEKQDEKIRELAAKYVAEQQAGSAPAAASGARSPKKKGSGKKRSDKSKKRRVPSSR